MNAALTLVRRELWEHRGIFVIVSAIIFTLIVLAALISGIAVGGGFTAFHPAGSADSADVAKLGLGIGGLFYYVYAIALIFYLSNSLYSDRQDKSVLFWRSLPVTDTATVMAKVGAAALLGPLVIWIATIAAHLIVLFALACMASARGAAGFSVFASPTALFGAWALFAYAMLIQALWWLPYFGYLLFVSAASRRVAVLWAILPPVIVGLLELIIVHTSYFFGFVTAHLGFSPVFESGGFEIKVSPEIAGGEHPLAFGFAWVTHFFALPSMWIGVGIGAVFLALAVLARRYSATA
jgi:ABC-2 type transport system permease protein